MDVHNMFIFLTVKETVHLSLTRHTVMTYSLATTMFFITRTRTHARTHTQTHSHTHQHTHTDKHPPHARTQHNTRESRAKATYTEKSTSVHMCVFHACEYVFKRRRNTGTHTEQSKHRYTHIH